VVKILERCPETIPAPLWETFYFYVTDNLYSDFFVDYSRKCWPGCCAAQLRTPRGPAQIPRETAGGTSDAGGHVASLV